MRSRRLDNRGCEAQADDPCRGLHAKAMGVLQVIVTGYKNTRKKQAQRKIEQRDPQIQEPYDVPERADLKEGGENAPHDEIKTP